MSKEEKRPVGRPRLGKIKLQFAVDPIFDLMIRILHKHYGITRSELIQRLVKKEYENLPKK